MLVPMPTEKKSGEYKLDSEPPETAPERPGTGHIPDKPDERDYPVAGARNPDGTWKIRPLGNLIPVGAPTPLRVQHRTAKIRNQQQTSSCVAFGFARHLNATYARLRGKDPNDIVYPSEPWIYGIGREGEPTDPDTGDFILDGGTSPRVVALKMIEHGIVAEKRLPFDPAKINKALPWDGAQAAFGAKVTKIHRVLTENEARVDELERIIASGYTVPYAQIVDDAMWDYSGGVLQPHKAMTEDSHYTVITGYDRERRVFIQDNSWGTNWGNSGTFETSYDRVANPTFCFDFIIATVIPDAGALR